MSSFVRPFLAAAAAVAVLILFGGCYYMPGSIAGNARVALAVKGVPANLSSVALVVTAPGMATISTTASTSAGSITVSVPPGPARTFTLMLNSPSATLEGVATVDLQPGDNKTINVTPTVGGTQLVIPDLQNKRLVQISDMTGASWTTLSSGLPSAINPTGTFMTPYAVDFDSLGRIYVTGQSTLGLFRIDDIINVSKGALVDATTGMTSLAIDRAHGVIYYSNGGTLFSRDVGLLTAIVQNGFSPDVLGTVQGMAADDQGILYMTELITTPTVVKFDPTKAPGSRLLATSTASFGNPRGIMVKGPYIYVCDSGAAKVVRLDKNLNFVDSFGGPSTDPFYGPEAFVATLNRKITVIDEKSNFFDRLAAFDDMTGTGWQTFGSSGAGVNQFDFYTTC